MSLENISQNRQQGLLSPVAAVLATHMLVDYARFHLITDSTPKSFTSNMVEVVALSVIATGFASYLSRNQGDFRLFPRNFTAITELVLKRPDIFAIHCICFSVRDGFRGWIESELDALAEKFCRQGESDQEKIKEAIRKVPVYRRSHVVMIASEVSSQDIGTEKIIGTIGAISNSCRDMREIMDAILCLSTDTSKKLFVNPCMNPSAEEKKEVVKYLMNLSAEEGKAFARLVLSVCNLDSMLHGNIELIKAIKDIPAEDREDVIRLANSVRAPNASSYEKMGLIKAIKDIPAEDREAVVGLVRSVCDLNSVFHRKIRLIKAIKDIPAGERGAVFRLAESVRAPNASSYEKMGLIEAVGKIPADDREDVIFLANSVCALNASSYEKVDLIIEAIGKIPAEDREDVIRLTKSVCALNASSYEKIELMQIIWKIPAEDREIVVRLSSHCIDPERDVAHRISAMEMIRDFSAEQRRSISELVEMSDLKALGWGDWGMSRQNLHSITAAILRSRIWQYAVFTDNVLNVFKNIIQDEIEERHIISIVERIARAILMHGVQGLGVLQDINRQRNANAIAEEIIEKFDQLLPPPLPHQHGQLGIDVHEGNRDLATRKAVERLYETQGDVAPGEIEQAKEEVIRHLDTLCSGDDELKAEDKDKAKEEVIRHLDMLRSGDDELKAKARALLAKRALLFPKQKWEDFGPLIDRVKFSVLGLLIDGAELVGRLWLFIQALDSPEKENATLGMINALAESYYETTGERICNPGKAQGLVVAVLQGRLAGVNIEEMSSIELTPTSLVKGFLSDERKKRMTYAEFFIKAAEEFFPDNSGVCKREFMDLIREYCRLSLYPCPGLAANRFLAEAGETQALRYENVIEKAHQLFESNPGSPRDEFIAKVFAGRFLAELKEEGAIQELRYEAVIEKAHQLFESNPGSPRDEFIAKVAANRFLAEEEIQALRYEDVIQKVEQFLGDNPEVPRDEFIAKVAANRFFAERKIQALRYEDVIQKVEQFLRDNPEVSRDAFIAKIAANRSVAGAEEEKKEEGATQALQYEGVVEEVEQFLQDNPQVPRDEFIAKVAANLPVAGAEEEKREEEEIQALHCKDVIEKREQFLQANPGIPRDEFIAEVEEYYLLVAGS